MLEGFIDKVLNEYGLFVAFLLITVCALVKVIQILWDRNKFLGDSLLDTVTHNTRVITKLVDRLERHDENH